MARPAQVTAARKAGADQADALLHRSTSLSIQRRLGQTEHVERSENRDLGLRVFVGQNDLAVDAEGGGHPGDQVQVGGVKFTCRRQ